MFNHITAAFAAPPPVRRGSLLVGSCEGGFWLPVDRRELRRVVTAARAYDRLHRQRGQRNGPLGHVALEVLDYLAAIVSQRTGRLEPSYETLMRKLRRSRDAIARALDALREHGFLSWLRRFEKVERDGPGPRLKQAANAYRLSLPRLAARLIGGPPPLPDIDRPEPVPPEEVSEFRAFTDRILAGLSCESGQRGEGKTKDA